MEEHWLPVKGYEGLYEVSDWGNVRSLNYNKTGETRLLRQGKDTRGYLFVNLCKDGKIKKERVHRLVAEAFLPNPNHLPQINHKDENKTNNVCCLPTNCNLEWCDAKYNINYGTHNQRLADSKSISIDQFDKDGNFVRRWKSAKEVERQLEINHGNICSCLKGRKNTAGGFIWKYAPKVETNI